MSGAIEIRRLSRGSGREPADQQAIRKGWFRKEARRAAANDAMAKKGPEDPTLS